MSHYISISHGGIMLEYSGTNEKHFFKTEDSAARALAAEVIRSGETSLLNSSSCNHPEDNGMPDFNFDRFVVSMAGIMRKLRDRPMAENNVIASCAEILSPELMRLMVSATKNFKLAIIREAAIVAFQEGIDNEHSTLIRDVLIWMRDNKTNIMDTKYPWSES